MRAWAGLLSRLWSTTASIPRLMGRYAGSPAATDQELHFADADKASGWALDALRWATENGIINGKGGGILDPTGQATRAETALQHQDLVAHNCRLSFSELTATEVRRFGNFLQTFCIWS